MTILFLSRRFYPHVGGVETHVLEVGKRLVDKGNTVTVITEEDDLSSGTQHKGKSFNEIHGIKVKRLNAGNDNRLKKFRIWTELWKLRALFKNADIVHCHDVFFWYLPFRFLYPKKLVFTTFHGYEGVFPPSKKSIAMRKFTEWLSMGNICVGDYINKWYGTKPDYVTYGVVNKSQNFHPKNSDLLAIALIGRLEKDIGIKTYLEAFKLLRQKRIKFELQIFGEGKLKKDLEKFGKIKGFKTNIDKSINRANIILASSYLTIMQALAARKVIIAVSENPLKEDYLKMSPFANFIYVCKNADEIVSVIESNKNDVWKSESMLENGYQWVKKQTWEKVTDIYLNLWKL